MKSSAGSQAALGGHWVAASQNIAYAGNFVEERANLEPLGSICHMGSHRLLLREKGPGLFFKVGHLSIHPKEGSEGSPYPLVQQDGRWKTTDEDRVSVPDG
ncbi:hypothetical protein [Bradyrhizobium sp. Arg816]|uniref:hypothetical protein n=1 Tax=Bradyrhizobium sp. Arg816 TaxID=2998491 RepID=UPI00249DAD2A|nr:hypothetical protein [Bradyrhizobium sp. Arg816]MDI3567495.1 hypothetical protein [Bradyrhizobium sp. Arg816]